jgi:hypothetical protein
MSRVLGIVATSELVTAERTAAFNKLVEELLVSARDMSKQVNVPRWN